MKKLLLALATSTALVSAPAMAADLGRPVYKTPVVAAAPYFNWSGFYIGGFVGGAFADRRDGSDVTAVETGSTGGVFAAGVPYNNLVPFGYNLDSSFIGGGTIGWNFQSTVSPFVFGIEGEAGYMRLRGSAAQPGSPGLDTVSTTRIGDWYGMITGRVGYAWDRTLIYVKGGGAFIEKSGRVVDTCTVAPCGPGLINASGKNNDFTWTVGGGLEFALNQSWSIKGEYMYIDTRDTFAVCGAGAGTAAGSTFCWNQSTPGVHTAKVGLNYRFNWGAPLMASY